MVTWPKVTVESCRDNPVAYTKTTVESCRDAALAAAGALSADISIRDIHADTGHRATPAGWSKQPMGSCRDG